MIVLDTNVLSELMRPEPDRAVVAWLSGLAERQAVSVISLTELTYGIARMPSGRRRDELTTAFQCLQEQLAPSTLDVTSAIAVTAALLRAEGEAVDRTLPSADALIAATCLSTGAALATRNTRDFANLGIDTVDPWHGAAGDV